jgi:hypothetical protein
VTRRGVAILALVAAWSLVIAPPLAAQEPTPSAPGNEAPSLGLERSDPDGPCGGYGFEIPAPGGAVACTHGPDPAPAGVELDQPPSLAQLRAFTLDAPGDGGVAGGADSQQVPCVGYGSAGTRVQAIYAYVAGSASRYADVAPLIRSWARDADDVFDTSAAQTGGSRHLRWLHDTACVPSVIELALSSGSVSNLGQMMAELVAAGLNRPDRRYVIWFDVSYLCGVAVTEPDDRPTADNLNNGVPSRYVHFARVDSACWGRPAPETLVEAHEIMHTIGAVQFSAPNTSGGPSYEEYWGHCIDEHDTMCYQNATPRPMVYRCPPSNERYLDCNHDDYFHTAPAAGSYLATHWNPAMSAFLTRVDPIGGFLDVDASIFRADIGWIEGAGITAGCSADGESYCPDALVTRGQMASFLTRALGLPPSGTDFFTDDGGSIHQPDINRVAAAGVATGCGGGRYCPTDLVTREQMASFLVRALGLPATGTDFFSDDAGSIHQADINRLAAAGIATGCGGGRYCPTQPVTRGQMAAFLHRAFT